MFKRTFNLEIEKAYADVKASFVSKGCKVISEDPPKHLLVKQGSLWGMLPETAKKIVDFTFVPINSTTQVTASCRISSDWKNITIIGCALAAVLAGLCLWISMDLTAFWGRERHLFGAGWPRSTAALMFQLLKLLLI